jgi:hypothetical protein
MADTFDDFIGFCLGNSYQLGLGVGFGVFFCGKISPLDNNKKPFRQKKSYWVLSKKLVPT